MVDCKYGNQISSYHDGELSSPLAAELEKHLPFCSPCSEELEAIRNLSGRLIQAPVPPVLRASGWALLHQEVDRWNTERRDRRLIHAARTLTAVAACLLLGASVWVFRANSTPAPQAKSWEQVAVTMQTEIPSVGGTDLAADWIVADASFTSLGDTGSPE